MKKIIIGAMVAMMPFYYALLAQPSDSGGGFDECDDCEETPIDNAYMLLIFLGLICAFYFLKKRHHSSIKIENQ